MEKLLILSFTKGNKSPFNNYFISCCFIFFNGFDLTVVYLISCHMIRVAVFLVAEMVVIKGLETEVMVVEVLEA